jgi:hypothetical protein
VAPGRLSPKAAVRRVPAEPVGSRLLAPIGPTGAARRCPLLGANQTSLDEPTLPFLTRADIAAFLKHSRALGIIIDLRQCSMSSSLLVC